MIDRFDLRQRRLFIAFLAVGFADATMAIRLLYFPVLFFFVEHGAYSCSMLMCN